MKKIIFFLLFNYLYSQDLFQYTKEGDNGNLFSSLNEQNINETDKFGWSLLMWAVRNRHLDTIKLLLEKKASVNIIKNNEDALSIAKYNNYTEIIDLLTDDTVIYDNLEKKEDEITGDITFRTYLFRYNQDYNGEKRIGTYRVFLKQEDGKQVFALGLILRNKKESVTLGVAYALKKQLDTFVKQLNDSEYNEEQYFTEKYTIIFDPEIFKELANQEGNINFGIRRGKVNFDFPVPASAFKALLKKMEELGWQTKNINDLNDSIDK